MVFVTGNFVCVEDLKCQKSNTCNIKFDNYGGIDYDDFGVKDYRVTLLLPALWAIIDDYYLCNWSFAKMVGVFKHSFTW